MNQETKIATAVCSFLSIELDIQFKEEGGVPDGLIDVIAKGLYSVDPKEELLLRIDNIESELSEFKFRFNQYVEDGEEAEA